MAKWRKAERWWESWQAQFGGRCQPGSGNQPGLPADIRFLERVRLIFDHMALMEVKSTERDSISIKGEWLDKVSFEAVQLGRQPLVGLTIGARYWLMVPALALTYGGEEHG